MLDNLDNPESSALSRAENKLTEQRKDLIKQLNEERFLWSVAMIFVIDAFLFLSIVDGIAAIAILALQLIFLLVLGVKLDVTYIDTIFKRITGMLRKSEDK